MALLSDIGTHVELNAVDKEKQTTTIFPVNTADDVFVDENGNVLTDALTFIINGEEKATGILNVSELSEEVIDNETLIARLTTDEEESFDDITPSDPGV